MSSPRAARALLLVLMPLLAYLPALRGEFVWDDDYNVTDNANLRDPEGLRRIWADTRSTQQYYPLTHTSFWIDYRLWGENPVGYHALTGPGAVAPDAVVRGPAVAGSAGSQYLSPRDAARPLARQGAR